MFDFLVEEQAQQGDIGQHRTFVASRSFFVPTRFPVFFPRFQFPFPFGFQFPYPQPYPPYPYPVAGSITAELRYDTSTSGPIQTSNPALLNALAILNASTGPVQVTLIANGQTVFSGSVAVAAPTSAIQALRSAAPSPVAPQYPFPYPYATYPPYGGVFPYFRGGFVLGTENQQPPAPTQP